MSTPTGKAQPVIWIANDTLGFGQAEVDRLIGENVHASCQYATLNADGKLDVTRSAPDEAWYGGQTQ